MKKVIFRNWSEGRYEVSVLVKYNPIIKTISYKSIGMVEKDGNGWICTTSDRKLTGKTRIEVVDKMIENIK